MKHFIDMTGSSYDPAKGSPDKNIEKSEAPGVIESERAHDVVSTSAQRDAA